MSFANTTRRVTVGTAVLSALTIAGFFSTRSRGTGADRADHDKRHLGSGGR